MIRHEEIDDNFLVICSKNIESNSHFSDNTVTRSATELKSRIETTDILKRNSLLDSQYQQFDDLGLIEKWDLSQHASHPDKNSHQYSHQRSFDHGVVRHFVKLQNDTVRIAAPPSQGVR